MALAIDRSHNSFDLTKGEKCFLIDNKHDGEIVATKRINIDYAEEWKEMPWRFILKDNKYVSKGN
jgi:DNA-3-methyladenine glycosylase